MVRVDNENMEDHEFAIYLLDGRGEETALRAKTLANAKQEAEKKYGEVEMTLKEYRDHDLAHQWDYVVEAGTWTQYE